MLLYHFTDTEHWPAILAAAEIRATWQRRMSPSTVHLSRGGDPESLPWALRTRRVRILVRVPDAEAYPWQEWAKQHLEPEELWSLTASSDPTVVGTPNQWNGKPEEWFVIERAVPMAEWEEVIDLETRSGLWIAGRETGGPGA
ncbi:hypothetical protein ACFY1L_13810 [Streptomyces sp. NPDC001663]|uniref:hypothetical protein n=1 Tax=Streptomyces sp. NPDC001663 TaxID=3364597 RepID=UPI00367A0B1C